MNLFITHSSEFTQALCAMLLNSLWQGLFLTLFAGAVILFTRRSRPALRYNLLVAGLSIFALSSGFSLYQQLTGFEEATQAVTVKYAEAEHPVQRIEGSDLELSTLLTDLFRSWSGALVWAWFIIVGMKCIRMSIGLYEVTQLKTHSVSPVSEEWERRIGELADHIGLRRPVRLLQSGLAKVPMVIGHLKPVILVPVGLATALSPAEVEAILLHELAHIRRRDYLVNLLQSVLEILFFFNPAVLWVSKLIKAERESCCDDISIRQTEQKAVYIRALLNCQEFQAVPDYALAMNGRESALVKRVKRIVSNHNSTLRSPEKTMLGLCILLACVISLSFSGTGTALPPIKGDHTLTVATTGTETSTLTATSATNVSRSASLVYHPEEVPVANENRADTAQRATVAQHTDCEPIAAIPPVSPVHPLRAAELKHLAALDAEQARLNGRLNIPAGEVLTDKEPEKTYPEDGPPPVPVPPVYVPYIPIPDTETYYPMDRTPPSMGQIVPFLSRRGSPVDITNSQITLTKEKLVVNGKTQTDQLHKEMMLAFGMPQGTVTWIARPG